MSERKSKRITLFLHKTLITPKTPRWEDEKSKDEFIRENDLKFLRKYQLKAIQALQDAVKKGSDRFLFEMQQAQERLSLLWQ